MAATNIEYAATGHSLDVTIPNSMDAQDWAVIWVEDYAGLASEDKPLPLDPRLVTADGPAGSS